MFELTPYGKYKYRDDTFRQLAKSLHSMFDDRFPAQVPFRMPASAAFGTDIRETDKEYVIEAELPGFRKEDIDIESSGSYLTIRASRKEENDDADEEKRYVRRERRYGEYVRRFYVPDLDDNGIQASMKDGVLSVRVARRGKPQAKKIEIRDDA